MMVEKIQVWPDRDDVSLCAYIQDDCPDISDGRRRPAIIVIPGGAYIFISDREAEPVALRFSGFGYHTFVLRYSVFINPAKWPSSWLDGTFMPSGGNPGCAYPGPLVDLAKAMMIIRKNAGRWMLDPEKIAVCGFSAGGHLAACLGVHWQDRFLQETLQAGYDECRPAAMILGYPVTDFARLHDDARLLRNIDAANTDLMRASSLATFGTSEPAHEELVKASPLYYVSRLTPPAFIWHTSADRLVPASQSLSFAAAMAEQGVPYELHVFESGPHGLSLADSTTGATADLVNEPAQAWVPLARSWLGRHLPVYPPAL